MIRVYEYVADDGTTYWSFTKQVPLISAPKRLVLQSRKGTILSLFLAQVRAQGLALFRTQSRKENTDGN